MIMGDFGAPVDLATQRDFFEKHIGSWAPRFFEDLEAARNVGELLHAGRHDRSAFHGDGNTRRFDMAA